MPLKHLLLSCFLWLIYLHTENSGYVLYTKQEGEKYPIRTLFIFFNIFLFLSERKG